MAWLEDVTRHVAARSGIDADALVVTEVDAQTLLDLAGYAAHETGERTNAPLLCHVLGRAVAAGASLADLDAAVRDYRA
ncbi:MAG: hypothetical protein QOI55_2942 [Actinomycetota bacterium]|jgi:hypothetical protein|nr:hypothetical protein [Actinomycetota bacterium]